MPLEANGVEALSLEAGVELNYRANTNERIIRSIFAPA